MPAEYDSRPDTYAHIGVVRRYLGWVAQALIDRADLHDASKLVDPELATFNEYTPRLSEVEYGSDEYRACLSGMREGLKHHYAHNRHHPEHHPTGIRDMNLLDIVEMLCDWKAAGERHSDGSIIRSIDMNQERFGYSDDLRQILLNTARELWPDAR